MKTPTEYANEVFDWLRAAGFTHGDIETLFAACQREAIEAAAKVSDAGERAAEREVAAERKNGNTGGEALALVARDVSRGTAHLVRALLAPATTTGGSTDA